MEIKPVISVAMLVYNHEKYLDHALQSIFAQKINVPFELIIGEDCSLDHSRDIINYWKSKYPAIIKPIYRDENVGMEKNTNEVIFSCQGDYVAWLEGDDFWIDENKLQKQFDFLESHREYIGVAHNTQVVDADEKLIPQYQEHYPFRKEQDFVWNDFKKGYTPGQTATFFYRNIFAEMNPDEKTIYCDCHANGDSCIIGMLLLKGKIKVLCDVMSAYRLVLGGGSNWNSISYGKNYSFIYFQKIRNLENMLSAFAHKRMELGGWRYRTMASSLLWIRRNNSEADREIFKQIWRLEKHKVRACLFCCKMAIVHLWKKIGRMTKTE